MSYSPIESCSAFKAGTCLCGFGGLTYPLYALRILSHQKCSAFRRTRRPFSRINSAILTPRKPACGSKDCRRLNRQMLWSLLPHGVRAGATATNMANNIRECLLQTELKTVQKHFPALRMLWPNNGEITSGTENKKCPERHALCHSTCGKYLAYRAKMDDISKQRMQAQALNEADVLRGDKIRRDVRNHGLPGHRRR